MSKPKKKNPPKKKAPASKPAAASPFESGARVRVVSGIWAGEPGTVEREAGGDVFVKLDCKRHQAAKPFLVTQIQLAA